MRSNKALVLDTGLLIAFARLELLEALPRLFREPCISDQVWRECQFDPARRDAQIIEQALDAKVIVRVETRAPKQGSFPANLGEGETSSIMLAEKRNCLIAVDDRSARRCAKNMGLEAFFSMRNVAE